MTAVATSNLDAVSGGAELSASGRWRWTRPVRTTLITSWEQAPGLADEWQHLMDRLPSASVFQTYEWHRCWWDAFGEGCELRLIVCHSEGQLVGIAPLMRSRPHSRLRRARDQLCFIGSSNNASDYCDFLIDSGMPQALDALMAGLLEEMPNADCLHLTNIPSHSPNYERLARFVRQSGTRYIAETDQVAPCRVLGNATEDRKAVNKNSLKRHFNYFNRTGALRFHRCAGSTEVLGYLYRFFDQHIARWKLVGITSPFEDPAQREFYRNLVCTLEPRGWLRFDVVLYNGEPLAFHLGFLFGNRFIWYKPSFDPDYASKSPGEVLIRFLLQSAIEDELEEFDFTVGDEAFKYRFANVVRHNRRLVVFQSRYAYWRYRLKSRLRAMIGPIVRPAKQAA